MEGNLIFAGLCLLSIILLLPFFTEGNIQDNYIGCYYDNVTDQNGLQQITLQNSTTLTIELCIGQCLLQSSTFAGLKNSKECLCGNNFGVMLADTSCKSLCPGNQSEYCGGSNGQKALYSLYAVCEIGYYGSMCDQVCHCKRQAPCYRTTGKCPNECDGKWFGTTCSDINLSEKDLGCFRDNAETRAIPGVYYYDERMTVEMCTNSCILRNNSFIGLQAGGHCFCGETYAKYGPLNDTDCSYPCPGNSLQKCGGALANSVYSVCPAGYYGPKCHNQCHCYNNSRCVYLTGECNSTCQAGWTAKSCNIRDCSLNNGGCSVNETCVTVDLKFSSITRCNCKQGYRRNRLWDTCTEFDECQLNPNPCNDTEREYCSNTDGSFLCTCKTGFQRYDMNGRCEVIDECKKNICDRTTTNCTKTAEGFVCACLIGYTCLNTTHCEDVSKICGQQDFPLGLVVGACVGSAVGSAIITIVVVYVVFFCRRRQQNKKSEDAAENRRKEVTDAKVETPISLFAYATLNKMPNEYDSAYTELAGNENRPKAKEIEKRFETGIREQLPANEFGRDTSKVYEELG